MLAGVFRPPAVQRASPTKPEVSKDERARSSLPIVLASSVPTVAKREAPLSTMLSISEEYAALRHTSHCPTGMYVIPSIDSLLLWTGVLFVHKGLYASSIFHFRVEFPPKYPELPPSVHFTTEVFHPLVLPKDGALTLAPRFSPWKPGEHHVFDVLYWIKYAFKTKTLDALSEEECLNTDAFRLYRDSRASFTGLVAQTSKLSQSHSALFERDQPQMPLGGGREDGIIFRPLDDVTLSNMRQRLKVNIWEDGKAEGS